MKAARTPARTAAIKAMSQPRWCKMCQGCHYAVPLRSFFRVIDFFFVLAFVIEWLCRIEPCQYNGARFSCWKMLEGVSNHGWIAEKKQHWSPLPWDWTTAYNEWHFNSAFHRSDVAWTAARKRVCEDAPQWSCFSPPVRQAQTHPEDNRSVEDFISARLLCKIRTANNPWFHEPLPMMLLTNIPSPQTSSLNLVDSPLAEGGPEGWGRNYCNRR